MLSTDIDDINEMVGVVPECEPYRESWQRIKTALAELGTTPNTGSPKLPTGEDVWNHVLEWREHKIAPVPDRDACRCVTQVVYDFICRQLRAGA